MKTRLMPIISILILATFVLMPGRGLGAGAKRQAVQPAIPQAPTAPALGTTTRVSVASDGSQGNGVGWFPSISADGRYVAFTSTASNLVSGDTNVGADIFVHDRQTGSTQRVSVASDGNQGNSDSFWPSISADGRYVAFSSSANNLVNGDTNDFCYNNFPDVFVHDPPTRTIMTPTPPWPPPPHSCADAFVHDRQTGGTQRVSVASDGSQGNHHSFAPSISADGRYVAFYSYADNLVSGDTNGYTDIFVHDRQSGVTQRVSVASDGSQGNDESSVASISADGRYVAFYSWASNLVSGDTNGYLDVFVHNRQIGVTQRVSVASDGSQGNLPSYSPSISADGRYVAFYSYADNLVSGDTNGYLDVFVHDRQIGVTQRVSVASDGSQGNYESREASISANGRYVAIFSFASNLVSGDTNGCTDIFVHDRQSRVTQRVSVASDGKQANGDSNELSVSANGRYVAFSSMASNLVSGDTNESYDVFVHERGYAIYLPVTQNQP